MDSLIPDVNMHSQIRSYWSFRDEITIDDGILLKGTRVIIPSCLTAKFLQDLHQGHQGITRTQQRARNHVYWPNMNQDVEEYIRSCDTCLFQWLVNSQMFHGTLLDPIYSH